MTNNSSRGFSLVELMVALMVGSFMAYALLSAGQYSLRLLTYDNQAWENLNFTQELLTTQGIKRLSRTSETWIVSPGYPDARWRTIQKSGNKEDILWIYMDTDFNNSVLHWSWPRLK
ncbi:MAG: PilW family protein [Desulfonatronovibrio sp.]|nr:prepilin-type N-terminal cleavage/methylation domain-containing protein [Desulfovibrionales bacterium]